MPIILKLFHGYHPKPDELPAKPPRFSTDSEQNELVELRQTVSSLQYDIRQVCYPTDLCFFSTSWPSYLKGHPSLRLVEAVGVSSPAASP